MISQRSIEEVIETARIDDVVRDFVDLKQRGANMIGLCPFHKEKTPSFSVSPTKNIFKCFGCGKGGTPVQFMMEAEQLSFPEAIRQLAKKYQITLEETNQKESSVEDRKETESLHIVNQFALDFYKHNLWENQIGQSVALSYFKERGFLESTIKKFELGFAFDQQDSLLIAAQKEAYKLDYLQKLGLVTNHQKDFFRNRVIFPIHNLSGKPIAFAGRILGSDPKAPKYINSPETELYQKSKTLYGLHLAKKSIREKNQCILVEGYTDVMALHQVGIENAVASSGTSLTEEQVQSIKRITTNTTILYDGDPAGIKAAMRGIDLLILEGMDVKIVMIPDNEDPDGFIKKIGADAFEEFIKNDAKDFIFYKLSLHAKDAENDPLKKSVAAKDVIQTIAKVEDPIKRSIYLKQTASALQLDELSLIEACNKLLREEYRIRSFQEKRKALDRDQQILKDLNEGDTLVSHQQIISLTNDEFQEKDICRVLILWGKELYDTVENISCAEYIIENISDTIPFFDNELIKNIILDISEQLTLGKIPDSNYFITHSNKSIADLALEFTMSKFEYSQNWVDRYGIYLSTQKPPEENFRLDITNSILRFKLKKYNKAISEFEKKIKNHSLNDEDLELELKSHQHIVNERNYLASLLKTVVI
ncbi:MAG: DNA primase [Saprospiraceae bacterium]|nr:DNA primase [Saprospiraceae bacterium]MBK9728405.1 DNA primase [Saprospiraceae bacterium]